MDALVPKNLAQIEKPRHGVGSSHSNHSQKPHPGRLEQKGQQQEGAAEWVIDEDHLGKATQTTSPAARRVALFRQPMLLPQLWWCRQ